ncbi:hypothetical protein HDU98_003015, partial [Podochytrium sp. JEL0797]
MFSKSLKLHSPTEISSAEQPMGLLNQEALAAVFRKCGGKYVAVTHTWGSFSNLYDAMSPTNLTPVSDLSKLICMQKLHAMGMWIDIYDVNQQLEKIKNAQVQWMGEVYFHADAVVWITTTKDEQTLTLLEDLTLLKVLDEAHIHEWAEKESERILGWQPARKSTSADHVGAFEHWARAWTYQEVALAKELHAVSPYTGREWNIPALKSKLGTVRRVLSKASVVESDEIKHLRRLTNGARSDFDLISQARPHGPSKHHSIKLDRFRVHREMTSTRIAGFAKDILFTHLWIFGIPKSELDYAKNVTWNIRRFCAYLISRGQMTIAANQATPAGVRNACWIPPQILELRDLDAKHKAGDTSVLQSISQQPKFAPLPVKVLDDGKLQVTTRVKQLHGDVWIAYLNVKDSVVFLKKQCHIV